MTHLLTLLADPARRAEMGRVGQERMRRALAWDHQAPRLLEAYAHALRGSPAPAPASPPA
uniref:glycosyltransferase n=1 Tax=Deinococcus rhizophilus TaxID=3049544 RepID=UPI0038992346